MPYTITYKGTCGGRGHGEICSYLYRYIIFLCVSLRAVDDKIPFCFAKLPLLIMWAALGPCALLGLARFRFTFFSFRRVPLFRGLCLMPAVPWMRRKEDTEEDNQISQISQLWIGIILLLFFRQKNIPLTTFSMYLQWPCVWKVFSFPCSLYSYLGLRPPPLLVRCRGRFLSFSSSSPRTFGDLNRSHGRKVKKKMHFFLSEWRRQFKLRY